MDIRKMNFNQRLALAVSLIAVISIGLLMFSGGKPVQQPNTGDTANIVNNQVAEPQTTNTGTTKNTNQVVSKPKAAASAYEQARLQYKDRTITFNNCTSLFANYIFKGGATLMLDGQSNFPQVVTIGSKNYSLKAHGYALATLEKVKTAKTIYLGCEAQGQKHYNIATISIQP